MNLDLEAIRARCEADETLQLLNEIERLRDKERHIVDELRRVRDILVLLPTWNGSRESSSPTRAWIAKAQVYLRRGEILQDTFRKNIKELADDIYGAHQYSEQDAKVVKDTISHLIGIWLP